MKLGQVGVAGEARCVITRADGTIKTDTGYFKNLILNQGLDFFGGGKGTSINQSCAIGSGNSTPVATQTKLDAFVAIASGTNITSDYSYVDDGSGLYKMWEQKQYRFEGLSNVNISELGLVSQGSASDYYLTTRILLKDALGAPTTITVKAGETLDIYYKIHKVIDTTDKNYVINVLDGDGGAVPYNIIIRSLGIGSSLINISEPFKSSRATMCSSAELQPITATDGIYTGGEFDNISWSNEPYVVGSYKIVMTRKLDLNSFNHNIRQINPNGSGSFPFLPFQMRIGRVSDDAPLTKTNKDTLTIPLEFSWGRFEGEL